MKDFETRLKRLEEIGETLRDGTVPLDKASKLFEEGLTLSKTLSAELQKIEKRVEILAGEISDETTTVEFDLFPDLTTGNDEPPDSGN